MSKKDDMRRTLTDIRATPARDGIHSPAQIAAMANLERGIAKIEEWEAKHPQTLTFHGKEKLKAAVDNPKLSDKQRERAKAILNRTPPRFSEKERRYFDL